MSGMIVKRVLIVFSIALIAVVTPAACRQEENKADSWEARCNIYQPPEKVMDAIGVKSGMVIGEVGAGRGRYVVPMARRVGDKGRVYANDIDEEALEYVRFRCRRDG